MELTAGYLPRAISLGYQGENQAREVRIDYGDWAEIYGAGTLSVLLQRNGDSAPYPVEVTAAEEHIAVWSVSSTDTAAAGAGRLQLDYTVGDVLAKSAVIQVYVMRSLGDGTEPPDPYESWIDTLTALGSETRENAEAAARSEENAAASARDAAGSERNADACALAAEESASDASAAAQAIQDMSVVAETLAEGSAAAVEKAVDAETGAVTLTFGIPAGDTGNGISGIALLSTSGLNKTYRVSMTDGTHFDFVVADGKGISSIALNSDYTMTVTYNDGTSWTSGSVRGETGATPELSIGTVSTLSPGSSATATITGTAETPVLNFGLPQGAAGEMTAASVASAFDATEDYETGDYVVYGGQLYKFTSDHDAGAWDANDAEAVGIADEVSVIVNETLAGVATESTAQSMLALEVDETFWMGRAVQVVDDLTDDLVAAVDAEIARLPQDENGQAIAESLGAGNSWLQQLLHEVEGTE